MSEYSEILDSWAMTIDPIDDNYEEKLKEVATTFRGFGDALTAFIKLHGYCGKDNASDKVLFLKEKFKQSKIAIPRNVEQWFDNDGWKSRDTAFKICFAFNLDVDGCNDFFRRVQFERSFDCHKINEAVYYFCIKEGLKYKDAEEIIEKINQTVDVCKSKTLPDENILYTSSIIDEINNIYEAEKLVSYVTENANNFSYNNATAIKFIKSLWCQISGPDGLAKKEGKYINKQLNIFSQEVNAKRDNFLDDDYITSEEDSSSWTIYTQILGLDNLQEEKFSEARSLSSVFKENILLPLKASSCFPNIQMLNSILRGELGENERYRKMIILLVFYTFWAKKIVEKKNIFYKIDARDCERCLYLINKYLVDAGYPVMYYGNPYDWIFMWALRDDYPLYAFRSYIQEVLIAGDKSAD